ncbi:DUF2199 domain-containing protein [Streptomyces kanamyceticus]|uniref:DUF2199 domain-containing protein n=1 Tax=Streptomyces kanamyceticus TaxID=1967 RepID=UPI0037DC9CCF
MGVWVSLSRENFTRAADLWDRPDREAEQPHFGCHGDHSRPRARHRGGRTPRRRWSAVVMAGDPRIADRGRTCRPEPPAAGAPARWTAGPADGVGLGSVNDAPGRGSRPAP